MARICHIVALFCLLIGSIASAHAAVPTSLAVLEFAQVESHEATSCQKLTAPSPLHKQCNGTGWQVSPAARSGPGKGDAVAVVPTGRSLFDAYTTPLVRREVLPDQHSAKRRRAHFWQIYAMSGRLRN